MTNLSLIYRCGPKSDLKRSDPAWFTPPTLDLGHFEVRRDSCHSSTMRNWALDDARCALSLSVSYLYFPSLLWKAAILAKLQGSRKKSQAASLKRKRNSRNRLRMARKRGFNSPLTASAHFYLSETPHSLSLTCTWCPAWGFFLPPLLYLLPVQHKKKIRTIKSHSLILSKSN